MSQASSLPPFQRFLEEHREVVYRYLRAVAGPDADDCFQETFLSALRAYPRLRDGRNLRGWVLAIASRKVVDGARARARRPEPVDRLPESPSTTARATPDGLDPLWDAVRDLPAKQRQALVQRFVLDLPYRDIGAAMGTTEEAARASVHQALRRLRMEVTDANA